MESPAVATPDPDGARLHTGAPAVAAPAVPRIRPGLTRRQRRVKRAFDLGACGLAIVLTGPFLVLAVLLIALAIYLESGGPILFGQRRLGEGGRPFRMLKFRTMVADRAPEEGRGWHKRAGDPRVTRVGRVLRRTSLDELPQLVNVLRGEMSLVGPRPEQVHIAVACYEPWQWQRLGVPPGLTGLWQIRGRSLRPLHLHTEDDLEYIRAYSLRLDLEILARTVVPVLVGRGAF